MAGLVSLFNPSANTIGGLSGADLGLIQQALGFGTQAMHNRYEQLGLGTPDPGVFGGDPATAAKAGGSLAYGGPGTSEIMDVQGLGNLAQAALGQLQTTNQTNPAIPGSAANQQQGLQNLASQQQGTGFSSNLNTPVNTTPSVSS